MVSRGDKRIVLWPIYFDKNASRKQGRRIPKKIAVTDPVINDIFKIAEQLSLNPTLEKKSYPSTWWKKGRILVDKKENKTVTIKLIANKLYTKKV